MRSFDVDGRGETERALSRRYSLTRKPRTSYWEVSTQTVALIAEAAATLPPGVAEVVSVGAGVAAGGAREPDWVGDSISWEGGSAGRTLEPCLGGGVHCTTSMLRCEVRKGEDWTRTCTLFSLKSKENSLPFRREMAWVLESSESTPLMLALESWRMEKSATPYDSMRIGS